MADFYENEDLDQIDVSNKDAIIQNVLNVPLAKKSWKNNSVVLKEDMAPSVSYVSLADLIKGAKLSHNAFIFDEKYLVLNSNNQVSPSGITNAVRFQISLGMPAYYKLGKKYKKTITIHRENEGEPGVTPAVINLLLPDPTDVFIPKNSIDIYASTYYDQTADECVFEGIPTDMDNSFTPRFSEVYALFHSPTGFNSATNTFSTSTDKNTHLIISGYNEVLAKDYLCDIYDSVRLNLASEEHSTVEMSQVLPTFLRMLLLHFCADQESYTLLLPEYYFDAEPGSGSQESDLGISNYLTNTELKRFFQSDAAIDLLERLYVYIQAPFVADYVDQENFGQNLSPTSTVGHKILTASDTGSTENYETIEGKHDQNRQVKYFPQQIPLKDALYNKYYKETNEAYSSYNTINGVEVNLTLPVEPEILEEPEVIARENFETDEDYESALELYYLNLAEYRESVALHDKWLAECNLKTLMYKLEQASFLKEANIGVPPYKYTTKGASALNSESILRNYTFYNPALKDEFIKSSTLESLPRVLPENGNLVIDGRIISPTTDELWYTLKKMISGRSADTIQAESADYKTRADRTENNFIDSRSISDEEARKESLDTRLHEIKTVNFKFKDKDDIEREGDPITTKTLKTNGVITSTQITEYLTQPTVNLLYVLPYLANRLQERFSLNHSSNVYDVLPKDLIKPLDTDNNDYTYSLVNSDENFLYQRGFGFQTEVHSIKNDRWSPREFPMSLRELEANIYGNRLNIESIIEWIDNDFTATGSYSFITRKEDEDIPSIQSTLFQLHKNYNKKFVNPDTLFNLYHVEDTPTEIKEFIDDPRGNYYDSTDYKPDFGMNIGLSHNVVEEEQEVIDTDLESRQGTYKRLPVTREFYGQNINDSQYKFDASKVVLCADGEYHYLNSSDGQVRFQCIRSRY